MRKIVQRLLNILELLGLSAFATLVIAAIVALRHLLDTPQPLESILPGTPHIYRWRHGHLFYKTLGDQDAPPLVLLHSLSVGSSSYEMRKVIGALAQKYRVYAPDLLGFGLSDRPKLDYSAQTYIELCHDFLSEVVGQPATLLASGLSCNYAVLVAKRYAETCTRLVLISPWELFGERQAQLRHMRKELLQAPPVSFLLYPVMSTRLALRYFMARQRSPIQGQISESDVEYLYATTHQFGAEHAPMALLAGKLGVDAPFDTLQQPVLVIWGARALNNAWSIASKHHMPENSEMALIQDAGLYVHEEYPAMVVENILEWSKEDKPEEPGLPTDEAQPGMEELVIAYCVRCKKKTPMQNPQQVTMKNGNLAVKGICAVCGAGQYRIGKL
ncbi:MAG: hypothetical protein NVSMB27_35720 [Ktedonobacteraceae bacterium]